MSAEVRIQYKNGHVLTVSAERLYEWAKDLGRCACCMSGDIGSDLGLLAKAIDDGKVVLAMQETHDAEEA